MFTVDEDRDEVVPAVKLETAGLDYDPSSQAPDLFINLGDNIYADTYSAAQMRSKCAGLWSNTDYQALRREVPVIAI